MKAGFRFVHIVDALLCHRNRSQYEHRRRLIKLIRVLNFVEHRMSRIVGGISTLEAVTAGPEVRYKMESVDKMSGIWSYRTAYDELLLLRVLVHLPRATAPVLLKLEAACEICCHWLRVCASVCFRWLHHEGVGWRV